MRLRLPTVDRTSALPIYLALLLCALGGAAIALAWGAVAGEATVADQLPALLLGGIGGTALVVLGVALLAAAVARRDSAARVRAHEDLLERLRELRAALGDPEDGP